MLVAHLTLTEGESRDLLVSLAASRKGWMIFRRDQTLAIPTTDVSRVAVKIPILWP